MFKKLFIVAIALSLILAAGCAGPDATQVELKTTNQQITQAVQAELDKLDLDMRNAAAELSRTGLSGDEARNILAGLAAKYPFIIDNCTTDPAGKMVTIAPDAYRNYEGTDISTQDVTVKFMQTKKPMLSQMFPAVEGMNAVVLMWPIETQNAEFAGSMSALFEPKTMISGASEPVLRGTDIVIDVFQLDGLDIYDSTGYDTDKNLFTDPAAQQLTDLIAMGHRMMSEESGSGSYNSIHPQTQVTVAKQAYWGTVKLHDTSWRIMCSKVVQ